MSGRGRRRAGHRYHGRAGRLGLSLTLSLGLLLSAAAGLCAGAVEYRVKAAYLYNFFLFVDWPSQAFASSTASFELCILGADPFGESLAPIVTKTARQRDIQLRQVPRGGNLEGCHLVFIGAAEVDQVPRLLAQSRGGHALTVSESPGFAKAGGMVGFVLDEGKVRLEVNTEALRRAGLHVSSKLLEVASAVYPR
jgi:hypothetical protein